MKKIESEHDYNVDLSKHNKIVSYLSNNPYRILGIPAGTSSEDITNSYKFLRNIVYSGRQIIPFVTDSIPSLSPIKRSVKLLDEAYEKLQNESNKLIYSYFWLFVESETQKRILNCLIDGNFEKAVDEYIEDFEESGTVQNRYLSFFLSNSHAPAVENLLLNVLNDDNEVIEIASEILCHETNLSADDIRHRIVCTLFELYDASVLKTYLNEKWKFDKDTILEYLKDDDEKDLFAEFFNPHNTTKDSYKINEAEKYSSNEEKSSTEKDDSTFPPEVKKWRDFALQFCPLQPRLTECLAKASIIIDGNLLYLPLINEAQKKWLTEAYLLRMNREYREFVENSSAEIIPVLAAEVEDIKKRISEREEMPSQDSILKEYTIGGVFPDSNLSGEDEIRPEITYSSFNLIISLTDLSDDEIESILDDEFKVSYLPVQSIPNLAFEFSNGFRCDIAINALKINKDRRKEWEESDDKTVELFLVDAGSRILKGIRFFDLPLMPDLKLECSRQNKYTLEGIEEGIKQIRSKLDVKGIISNAIRRNIIPPVENTL